ncbi:MAG TPA: hypothetical protein VEQ17_10980, partial [Steroidobacteraceae bacterium]|nr:hypothetical protein [Steroidobacteraceae bacterium]
GLPVGTVLEVVRDPDEILARVRVKPRATLAQDRQVIALWFDPDHPAAPVNPALARDLPEAPLAQPVLRPPPAPAASPPAAASAPAAAKPAPATPPAASPGQESR